MNSQKKGLQTQRMTSVTRKGVGLEQVELLEPGTLEEETEVQSSEAWLERAQFFNPFLINAMMQQFIIHYSHSVIV